ncbi:MAG TPA: hypothetical protein VKX39_06310, partial [Bryobacteraceae bacterium]|nr:hypothetical protein [Bryobacteraceae bacterium]
AWNVIPAVGPDGQPIPLAVRAFYASVYLTAMRDNWGLWDGLTDSDPLFKSLDIKPFPYDPNPDNLALAYAQHYMIGRYMAANTGDFPGSIGAVTGYEGLKLIDFLLGKKDNLKTTTQHQPSPPSTDAVQWGVKGVLKGMDDYHSTHNGKDGDPGDAVILLWPHITRGLKLPENTPNYPGMVKVILKILQIIIHLRTFSPKGAKAAAMMCPAGSGPQAQTSVQGKLLSPQSGGDTGTAA